MSLSIQTTAHGIRRDRTGILTEALTSLVEEGERLHEHAGLIDCRASLGSFRQLHRRWILSCLPVLAEGFEPESVGEFLYASTRIPRHREPMPASRAALVATRDALELLRGLCSTLEHGSGG